MINQPFFPPTPDVVAVAIIQRGEEVFLTKRKDHVNQGGLWEFPGGKQQEGETLEQCLRRELKEELDIEVGDLQPFQSVHYQYPGKPVVLHFFTCLITQGLPEPLDCAEMAWVSQANLSAFEFPTANKQVVTRIIEGKLWNLSDLTSQ